MKKKEHNQKRRVILLLVLLAALCIGGTELAACRHFDPELYQRLIAPVRAGAEAAAGAFQYACTRVAQSWEAFTLQVEEFTLQVKEFAASLEKPEPEPEPSDDLESQLATDPSLVNDVPITDPSVTEFKEIDGQEILTGGMVSVVYFNQGEEPWASQPYGSDKIAGYGCGPTAMAMVVSSLTDQECDPAFMAQWAVEHGYWARKSGSRHAIVEGTARAFGLQAESFTGRTPEAIWEVLLSGKVLVALMGPGHFTQRGHFIVLHGTTLSGTVLVADPNSRERSLTEWDPQLILDELSSSTNNGAPLWVISPPSPGLDEPA